MTNLALLQETLDKSNQSFTDICKNAGMLRETLYNRLKGRGQFKASEIQALSEALHLSVHQRDAIFFSRESE